MFKKGEWYQKPRKLLKHRLGANVQAFNDASLRRMVEVEYGLRLMQMLNILEEPIISLPDLLTLHELPALRHYSDAEWQLLMFARCRIPNYLSHQRWRDDLREYALLPMSAMLFDVSNTINLDEQLVGQTSKKLELADHLSNYDDIIKSRPPYQRSTYNPASAGAIYYFDAYPDKGTRRYPVSITLPESLSIPPPEWYAKVPKTDDDALLERFIKSQQKGKRKAIVLNWEKHIVAEARIMQAQDPIRNWEKRIGEMQFNNESSDGDLIIDGQVHLVGMVGAGKSTLVKTIAHHLVRTSEEIRIAVIVPSTMDAFSFAHEINEILACEWDKPAAVAYFGWSGRDKHIRAFLNEYGNQPTHFGHRWVSQSCAAMSLMPPGEMANMQSAPRPGSEPCEVLASSPLRSEAEDTEAFKAPERNTSCPFFAQCPSHQKLRDLKNARIIVTTAGALQSRLPVFFDPRRLLLSDYIYEQTDLVFVDEADEVQAFEDDLFVNTVPLWNHPQALFYATDASVSAALRQDALSEIEENWAFSVRDGAKYILPILRILHQTGNSSLRKWIGRSYFSAYRLFQTIARRMVGLPDWVSPHDMNPVETQQYELLSAIFSLLTAHDMTKLPDVDLASEQEILRFGSPQVVRYACKLRDILARAVANIPRQFEEELLRLMEAILSDLDLSLDASLAKLEANLREPNMEKPKYLPADERETKQTLAHKLMFCLLSAGLDREIRALVYNSDAQPSAVSSVIDIRDFNPNFRSTHTGLPTAYTGSVFGTYYTPDERSPEHNKGERGEQEVLARLEYVNPGRELLLQYHELYRLFGIYGPHVVYLSGTSYLPDSSRWHIRTPIGAVLEANPQWSDTIQSLSEYFFSPAFSQDERPIRVSGAGETSTESNLSKDEALQEIARYWGRKKILEKQLLDLEERGRVSEVWSDRSRLLLFVNSYDQAQVLGKAIRQYSSLRDEEIQWLTPSDDEKRLDGVSRGSIESVASSQLRVLVAPLSAIGRGHNILTVDKSKAAFGSAYFVVRPLNPPGDVNGIAAEINCYGAQWLDKSKPNTQIAHKRFIFQQETELRRLALEHWHKAERRSYYKYLSAPERHDLGATSLGRFVQAAGRLVRGGVPMLVHFVDAAWAPVSAERQLGKHRKNDTPETSLLVEMICRLAHYTRPEDKYGRILYQPFTGMFRTKGLYYSKDICDEKH